MGCQEFQALLFDAQATDCFGDGLWGDLGNKQLLGIPLRARCDACGTHSGPEMPKSRLGENAANAASHGKECREMQGQTGQKASRALRDDDDDVDGDDDVQPGFLVPLEA